VSATLSARTGLRHRLESTATAALALELNVFIGGRTDRSRDLHLAPPAPPGVLVAHPSLSSDWHTAAPGVPCGTARRPVTSVPNGLIIDNRHRPIGARHPGSFRQGKTVHGHQEVGALLVAMAVVRPAPCRWWHGRIPYKDRVLRPSSSTSRKAASRPY